LKVLKALLPTILTLTAAAPSAPPSTIACSWRRGHRCTALPAPATPASLTKRKMACAGTCQIG
jgi:hypothetical protein